SFRRPLHMGQHDDGTITEVAKCSSFIESSGIASISASAGAREFDVKAFEILIVSFGILGPPTRKKAPKRTTPVHERCVANLYKVSLTKDFGSLPSAAFIRFC